MSRAGRLLGGNGWRRWGGVDADARREERVALVLRLVDRFVYDLGLLLAGRPVDLHDYVAPPAAARLEQALGSVAGRAAIRPEFGEFAQVRIEGDVLDSYAPVRTVVEFDDHSSRIGADGALLTRPRRRIRLRLLFDAPITMVLDHRVDIA